MKKINFRKFVFGFSVISLISGFFLSYFKEPSREEKVLRALNYDLRFTEKLSSNSSERKPTSTNEDDLNDFHSVLATYNAFAINKEWRIIPELTALTRINETTNSKGYFKFNKFFILKDFEKSNSNTNFFWPVIHNKTNAIGLLANEFSIQIKPDINAQSFGDRYQLHILKSNKRTNTFTISTKNAHEFIDIYHKIKDDKNLLSIDLTILDPKN